MMDLAAAFGQIDIYLFDQLLRGRILPGMTVLDAGCGAGRNVTYLLRNGFDVSGTDANPRAIEAIRSLAAQLAPSLPPSNFHVEPVEAMTFPDGAFDAVISSAVLHFARDDTQFAAMLEGSWRPLAAGGIFFYRLASTIGMADRVKPVGNGRYVLPDLSERYLVDEPMLAEWTARLGADTIDPIKTTVVQDQRAMTTWVLRKRL